MQKRKIKKGLVVGVIAVFLGLALMPAIGTQNAVDLKGIHTEIIETSDTEIYKESRELIEIEVTEYKPDGSIETREVYLTQSEINNLKNKLRDAQTLDEEFSILKLYGLIPVDASLEVLETDMEKLAEKMQLTEEKIHKIASRDIWLPPISLSFFSEVSATFRLGNSLRIGMTPFLRLINHFLKYDISRGIDMVDMCWGLRGSVFTTGCLGEHSLYLKLGYLFLIGFIGYSIKIPFFRHSFIGASVMTFTAGFGSHDFDPWFP